MEAYNVPRTEVENFSLLVVHAKTKNMLTFSSSGQEPVSYLVELFEQTVHSSVLIFQEFTDDL